MGFVYTLSLLYQIAHLGLKEKPYPEAWRKAWVARTSRRFEPVKKSASLSF
jgi:hypothetical protein